MNNFCEEDTTPYKKKKDQKSKSNKRSNHKHQYKKIIIKSFIGWQWAEKCEICGRIKYKFTLSDKEFRRPETLGAPYLNRQCYYTYEELLKLFPNYEIINQDMWELN